MDFNVCSCVPNLIKVYAYDLPLRKIFVFIVTPSGDLETSWFWKCCLMNDKLRFLSFASSQFFFANIF